MERRLVWILTTVVALGAGCMSVADRPAATVAPATQPERPAAPLTPVAASVLSPLPGRMAGLTLEQLRDDYRDRLFKQYLPFWENGGIDEQLGGVLCELNDDGTVADDEKHIWYQGRAIWVYSYLYNHFGKDPKHLAIARKTRDFMVKHMYVGEGKWNEKVLRDGTLKAGVGRNVYGWLFAAAGLAELYRAAGDPADLKLAKDTIWASVKAYDDPAYGGSGRRTQGHSMVLIWLLADFLSHHHDPELEALQRKHVSLALERFWNPKYGVVNESLAHDYSRRPEYEDTMCPGHTMEVLWMVMHEAVRTGDRKTFDTAKQRVRRVIEMCWDPVYEGFAANSFRVFGSERRSAGPYLEEKVMWAQTEVLIACMTVYEYTGEAWAREWYERTRAFTLRTMANTGHGVWRQAVDRFGRDKKRRNYSVHRRGNFHQPRYFMLNLRSLERMIANKGKLTPFPAPKQRP